MPEHFLHIVESVNSGVCVCLINKLLQRVPATCSYKYGTKIPDVGLGITDNDNMVFA